MTARTVQTGGEALLDALLANGITTLFGLPGVQLDPFFAALFDRQEELTVINARHEQGVAYMAYGYAQSTGRIGTYAVVPGPGVLNTTAALSTAYSCNTPVLLVTGQIPSAMIGAKRGQLHELPDQLGILERLTKRALRMRHPSEAGEMLNGLLHTMRSGRPGPVAIEAAPDILAMQAPTRPCRAPPDPVPPPVDQDKIAKAARILGRAERPMILVGGGAFHASNEITELARLLSAPVLSWMLGRGTVDDRTGLSVNRPAGGQWWRETDAVLCIGSRGEYERATWGLDPDMAFIHVDIDPEELTRVSRPDVAILGDSREVATLLLNAIPAENRTRSGRMEDIAALRKRTRAYLDERLGPQMAWLDAMRRALPEDGYFVEEFTQVGYVSRIGFPAYFPRSIVTPGYQGTLGYGYATALGVQAANPEKAVLSVSGDGGFLFTANEIATAVHYGLPLVAVVFEDGAYGNVQRMQRELYGNRVIATNFSNPDFVKYAESFGADGRRVHTPGELETALGEAFKARRPTVIVVPVGQFPDPWPIFMSKPPAGRGRGAMPDFGEEAANPFV
jgi:acetolactate synthase-1/2/3 large subunit